MGQALTVNLRTSVACLVADKWKWHSYSLNVMADSIVKQVNANICENQRFTCS